MFFSSSLQRQRAGERIQHARELDMGFWTGFYLVSFLHVVFGSPETSYTVHLNKLSFEDAQNYCRPGGFLANLKNEAEIAKIQKAIWERNSKTAIAFWIGLKKKKGSCVDRSVPLKGFYWTVDNGVDLHGIGWKGEPLGTCTDERCGLLSVEYGDSATHNGGLVSAACKQKNPFVCKRNISVPCDPPSIFGTHDIIENLNDPYRREIICSSGDKFTLTCSNDRVWNVVGDENVDISQLCLQCENGYRRDASGNCVDINECEASNPCKHTCVNTEGSYKCACSHTDGDSGDCSELMTPATDPTYSKTNRDKSVLTQPTSLPEGARTNETAVHIKDNNGDISNIIVPLIIALLILAVLLVIVAAIVKGCLISRSIRLAQRRAEAVALNGSSAPEKMNENKGHLNERV